MCKAIVLCVNMVRNRAAQYQWEGGLLCAQTEAPFLRENKKAYYSERKESNSSWFLDVLYGV
jgi:uncharacterized protein involved in tolerance to divalent cations